MEGSPVKAKNQKTSPDPDPSAASGGTSPWQGRLVRLSRFARFFYLCQKYIITVCEATYMHYSLIKRIDSTGTFYTEIREDLFFSDFINGRKGMSLMLRSCAW